MLVEEYPDKISWSRHWRGGLLVRVKYGRYKNKERGIEKREQRIIIWYNKEKIRERGGVRVLLKGKGLMTHP